MTRQTNQRIVRGCFGNGITWGDAVSDKTVAHVSQEGKITWYSEYKKKISEEVKKDVEETSLKYQAQAMISIESIIRPRYDSKIMATYMYVASEGAYKNLAYVFYPNSSTQGGIRLTVWEGIIPPEILEEINQLYKSKFPLEIAK